MKLSHPLFFFAASTTTAFMTTSAFRCTILFKTIAAFVPPARTGGTRTLGFSATSSSMLSSSSSHRARTTTTTTTMSSSSSAISGGGDDDNNNNNKGIIQLQSSISTSKSESLTEQEHLEYQAGIFDNMSDWFADKEKEVTPDLEPVYKEMVQEMLDTIIMEQKKKPQPMPDTTTREDVDDDDNDDDDTTTSNDDDTSNGGPQVVCHILDVACGTGVLWEYFIEAANRADIRLAITGVDLSSGMIAYAAKRANQLVKEHPQHAIETFESDILEYCKQQSQQHSKSFDGVVLNACFGNFWDPGQVLQAAPAQTICISHPLGAEFVQELHGKDPKTVPHVLPETTFEVMRWTHELPMVPLSTSVNKEYYLACLTKCRAKGLAKIHRFRGTVDQGYGRGGKKLGVPTANLPSSLFQNALEDVPTGVYFGWTALENKNAPDKVFKAVVNVGYSPTFEGQENPERIIEAHLIEADLQDDFYGVPMRLQLIGYLREEKKFDSFPELIAQIHADVQDAKNTLDQIPYDSCKQDDFLITKNQWIGASGGDKTASWEFTPMMDTLKELLK